MIYLDHAATTPLLLETKNFLLQSLEEDFANASASHKLGKNLHKKIDKARKSLLEMLHAEKDQRLIFTASATESNNMIIKGLSLNPEDAILYSKADHPSLVEPVESLAQNKIVMPIVMGEIDQVRLVEILSSNIKLIVLSHVNNQSGTIQEIKTLVKLFRLHLKNVHIHLDAVQSFGKIALNITDLDVDSLALSAHKIGGPKGVAALVLPEKCQIIPLILGGGQEENLRSGTLSTPLILAFEVSAKIMTATLENAQNDLQELSMKIQEALSEHDNIVFPFQKSSPYILTFLIKGIASDIILRHLEMHDIYASSSSACSAKIKGKSELFSALGLDESVHKNVLRISMARSTTKEDIERFIAILTQILNELKGLIKYV
jgi:cysteine desulfurase